MQSTLVSVMAEIHSATRTQNRKRPQKEYGFGVESWFWGNLHCSKSKMGNSNT